MHTTIKIWDAESSQILIISFSISISYQTLTHPS